MLYFELVCGSNQARPTFALRVFKFPVEAFDGGKQCSAEIIFVHASMSASLKHSRQHLNRIMLAHDNDLRVGRFLSEYPGHVQSIHAGHTYVEKDDIGTEFLCFSQRLFTVCGLSTHMPFGSAGKKRGHTASDHFIVVNDEDLHKFERILLFSRPSFAR